MKKLDTKYPRIYGYFYSVREPHSALTVNRCRISLPVNPVIYDVVSVTLLCIS